MIKVIKNPKTGMMETVEVPNPVSKESLARQHKELRDMLDGNTQFHVDPNAAPKPKPVEEDDTFHYGEGFESYYYGYPYGI